MGIPASLQQAGVYRLPATLITAYRDELTHNSLLERARSDANRNEVHGGESKDETEDHFAYRFQNSACRPLHLLLTQSRQFKDIQADLLSTFASHHVSILDLACGTGAGTLSLLSLLAELRRENVLPSLPLSVDVLGADYSQTARTIFTNMCRRLAPELAKSAINLKFRTAHWDAQHSDATSALCDEWLSEDTNEYLIIVNNFSGHGSKIHDSLEWSWKHLGDRIFSVPTATNATWTWLENDINSGEKFLRKIRNFFAAQMKRTFPHEFIAVAEKYKFYDHIKGRDVDSGVVAHQYRR